MKLEHQCLTTLRKYDSNQVKVRTALEALCAYDEFCDPVRRNRREAYRETLEDRPWRTCKCGICEQAGIDVAMFRGAERNKRRGFHNLHVFRQRIRRGVEGSAA